MYKQLILDTERIPYLSDYSLNPLLSGEIRVKSQYGSPKHGTEVTFAIDDPYACVYYDDESRIFKEKHKEPCAGTFPLGNMFVGNVIETASDVTKFNVGDKVTGYGGLKEIHTLHEEGLLWKMNGHMTWREAVCFDPLQFALGGFRDGNVRAGDKILISGLGAIGLMAVQLSKRSGVTFVAVSDPIAKRRELALSLGADTAFDPITQDIGLEIRKYTKNVGVDVVIETSGSYKAMEQGFRSLGYQGTQCIVGWMRQCDTPIHLGYEAHWNQLKLIFSAVWRNPNPDYPRFCFERIMDECWYMLSEGWFDCDAMIHPIVRFEDCAEAYKDVVINHPEKSIKMGVIFDV